MFFRGKSGSYVSLCLCWRLVSSLHTTHQIWSGKFSGSLSRYCRSDQQICFAAFQQVLSIKIQGWHHIYERVVFPPAYSFGCSFNGHSEIYIEECQWAPPLPPHWPAPPAQSITHCIYLIRARKLIVWTKNRKCLQTIIHWSLFSHLVTGNDPPFTLRCCRLQWRLLMLVHGWASSSSPLPPGRRRRFLAIGENHRVRDIVGYHCRFGLL